MREENPVVPRDDDELDLFEWIGFLKTRWPWWVSGGVMGLLGAGGILAVVPAQYEATAVLQPAVIGAAPSATVEPVMQTLERLKLVTFYGDESVKACQASAGSLAQAVKAKSANKENNLLALSYRGPSASLAKVCLEKIIDQLIKSQALMAAPLLKELEDQMTFTKQQIESAEHFLTQNEKPLSAAPAGAVLWMLKRDELTRLQKLYREQRIQMTDSLTHPMKLLEPVYAPEKVVFPNQSLTIVASLIVGLLAGLFGLFVSESWRRHRARSLDAGRV